MKILIAFASVHGSTWEVAEFMGRLLRAYDADVDVMNVKDVHDLTGYDLFIMGTAIHGGLWLQEMCDFTERYLGKLGAKPSYMWLNCIRAIEPDGVKHAKEFYVDQSVIKALDMRDIAIFAGKLNTDSIDWKEHWLLASDYDGNLIPGRINYDFRDWQAIALWAHGIAKSFDLKPTFASLASEPAKEVDGANKV